MFVAVEVLSSFEDADGDEVAQSVILTRVAAEFPDGKLAVSREFKYLFLTPCRHAQCAEVFTMSLN
jgi:hypothetical protein